jgi:hypothetical protein
MLKMKMKGIETWVNWLLLGDILYNVGISIFSFNPLNEKIEILIVY